MKHEIIEDKEYLNQQDKKVKVLYNCILNNCKKSLTEIDTQKIANIISIAEYFVKLLNNYYTEHNITNTVTIEYLHFSDCKITSMQIVIKDKNNDCISYHAISDTSEV